MVSIMRIKERRGKERNAFDIKKCFGVKIKNTQINVKGKKGEQRRKRNTCAACSGVNFFFCKFLTMSIPWSSNFDEPFSLSALNSL